MTVQPAVPDGRLRVTSGQRENAVAIVREAAADGRLDFAELDQRVGTALRSKTREDLAEILADLVPTDEMGTALATAGPMGEGPGFSWEKPLMIEGDWRRRTIRRGVWEVPPFLEVSTGAAASVMLDMTHANCRSRIVDLMVTSAGGTVTVVVPEGWGVDIQGVQSGGMSATIASRVPTRGEPRIIVRGRTAGALKVRRPRRRELAAHHRSTR